LNPGESMRLYFACYLQAAPVWRLRRSAFGLSSP
jgi:hypothetical protein